MRKFHECPLQGNDSMIWPMIIFQIPATAELPVACVTGWLRPLIEYGTSLIRLTRIGECRY